MAHSDNNKNTDDLAAENSHLITRIENLIQIGIALSAEKNLEHLLEKILIEAQGLTHADAGTLYLITDDEQLSFEIMRTRSLGIALGGSTGRAVQLAPIPLYDADGHPNNRAVSAYTALTGETINIEDAYTASGFDFSGTKAYDKKIGYRSKSFLTLPMKNHENRIIGVLQLINASHPLNDEIISFSREDQQLAEALASQAAVALTNRHLLDDLRTLLEKFIEVIATAIDEKSPYTGGHCRRVPEIAMRLAQAVHDAAKGPYADLRFSDEELYELKIAALLHDCGKITTPVHVVDKGTKLETIYNRIELIETRFAIIKKQAEIDYLRKLAQEQDEAALQKEYDHTLETLDEELVFLQHANIGSECMSEADQARVRQIAKRQYTDHNGKHLPLLSDEEVYNLTIPKGTLTPEERDVINYHIVSTINMLERLPFPKHLRNVPEIAGGHHETMDGRGYPRGLNREQMSVQARIMGIADIFEALTAADRPYKKAMPISQALGILGRMKNNNHIDPDLFDIFINAKVYENYARDFLDERQLDPVDLEKLPGYRPL
ncbi:MAG: HD domain-containing phosphohydrolase [Granulosicoccaceae bacterium]